MTNKNFVVCMRSSWVRDAQFADTKRLRDEELGELHNTPYEDVWKDIEPSPFIAICSATNSAEACRCVAQQKDLDVRCLYAIEV